MFIETNTLIYILITQAALFFLLIGFYFVYVKEENKKKNIVVSVEEEKILREAHEKAENIIEKAVEEAQKILINGQYLREDLQMEISASLNKALLKSLEEIGKATDIFRNDYDKLFSSFKVEYAAETKKIIGQLHEEAESEVADFGKIIKNETLEAQKFIGEKINAEFEKVRQEIEVYRKDQIDQVNKSIEKLTSRILEEVLGKIIPASDQEKLVVDALEKAKREGVFLE